MKSIGKILVPVDYSAHSANAMAFAIPLAKKANARLIIFHAFPIQIPPTSVGLGQMPVLTLEEQTQLAIQSMETFLKESAIGSDVKYDKRIVPGPLVECISEINKEEGIDLIVMGTKGATGLKETFVGSNTARVMEDIDCAVLVVPEQAKYEPLDKIAFAYDNTEEQENEEQRMEILRSISSLYNSYLEIVTVENPDDIEDKETIENDLHAKLKGIEKKIDVIVHKNVELALYDYIDHEHVNLLTIFKQKHSFLDRLFRESLTRKLAYHVKIPLLAL